MKWFLIATVMVSLTGEIQLKVNEAFNFKSSDECNEFLDANRHALGEGLLEIFPDVEILSMSCVDKDTANELQKNLEKSI